MTFSAKEWIPRRRSVRTFDGRPLTEEDRRQLEAFLSALSDPFGVPVSFRLLNAKEHGLTSPVIVGAEEYLAAKVRRAPHCEISFGYRFETACLFACSRGIGTVMLAASLSRAAFERAMDVQSDEVLPLASPVGYPADKRSVRENLMRRALRADERRPFETLFFAGSFEKELRREDAGVFADALEAARLAPSAANGQPWRAVADGDLVHFYEAKSMKDSPLGDVQLLDVGIALSHFDLVRAEDGVAGGFLFADPQLDAPENVRYVVSFQKAR